jgi:hypothetical protein
MPEYDAIVAEKTTLYDDGQRWTASELASIEQSPTTSIVFDYSSVSETKVAMSFTPFGIVAVDNERTIFRLVPISAKIGDGTRFQQTRPAPVLQNRQTHRFTFSLPERVSREQLLQAIHATDLPDTPITVEEIVLPGVKIQSKEVLVKWQEGRIVFTLCGQ